VAHYICELGERALQQHDAEAALNYADQALDEDQACVRAGLLRGRCCESRGDFGAAVQAYRQVEEQDAGLAPEVTVALQRCYAALGDNAARQGAADVDAAGQRPGAHEARYRCVACGFSSRKLFWQCPGCQGWSTVKPIAAGDVK
jgi:lipopolysaccharide biosynthesis regulator YciM